MAQFKVGDRVKLVKEFGGWCLSNVGKEGVIVTKGRKDCQWVRVKFDGSSGDMFETDYGNPDHLVLISTTPPATIQHKGYNYTRGEPVVPDWVKDGAWVVDVVHGRVLQMRSYGCDGYNLYDQKGNIAALDPDIGSRERFHPFTNEDWKWGMWAEYKGEKVFVHGTGLTGVFASRPGNGYFPAPFSEITPTTAP